MIVKVEITQRDPVRCLVIDGRGFSYEGGLNPDMIEAMGSNAVAFFEAELTAEGLVVGKEVTEADFLPSS